MQQNAPPLSKGKRGGAPFHTSTSFGWGSESCNPFDYNKKASACQTTGHGTRERIDRCSHVGEDDATEAMKRLRPVTAESDAGNGKGGLGEEFPRMLSETPARERLRGFRSWHFSPQPPDFILVPEGRLELPRAYTH